MKYSFAIACVLALCVATSAQASTPVAPHDPVAPQQIGTRSTELQLSQIVRDHRRPIIIRDHRFPDGVVRTRQIGGCKYGQLHCRPRR